MSYLSEWWVALVPALKVYWSIAIPSSVFFVLQWILIFIGGDLDDSAGFADETSSKGGKLFQFFTVKSTAAFLTVFGWAGITSIGSGVPHEWSIVAAVVSGILVMSITAVISHLSGRAGVRKNLYFRNAIGETGQVYQTIRARRGSQGQVQIKIQGVLRTLRAVTDDENDLSNGKTIIVMRVMGDNTLLVTER